MSFVICHPVVQPPGVVVDLNKQRCFEIPMLIVEFPRVGPDPFFSRVAKAIRIVFKPQPDPWVPSTLVNSGLRIETIRDARLLATVDALSEQLSPALRGTLASSIRSAASQLDLPEGGDVTIAA